MTEEIFDLKAKPDETRVEARFCKKVITKDPEEGYGISVRCRGGSKAVTTLIDRLNKAIPGDE